MTETPVGGYVRHRDRMVQESVFQDLRDTLIACNWLAGTTSEPVQDPADDTWGIKVVAEADTLALLEGHPIVLIDYVPETEDDEGATVDDDSNGTALNTFAMSNGEPGDPTLLELGSNAEIQPYVFHFAFYAVSDAVALAVMNDLRDRYRSRLVRPDTIDLFDYNATPPALVVRMDVEEFRYAFNAEAVAPHEVHLYFGELSLSDYVDAR